MADAHTDYSGTPLWKKLGIREGSRVFIGGEVPVGFFLGPSAPPMDQRTRLGREMDVVLHFSTSIAEIRRRFPSLAKSMDPAGRLWIAWPKRAAKVPTDTSFEDVQGIGLAAGLVDNKSASITDAFQGIQFVMRLRDRPAGPRARRGGPGAG
jgi:hypothetical protein